MISIYTAILQEFSGDRCITDHLTSSWPYNFSPNLFIELVLFSRGVLWYDVYDQVNLPDMAIILLSRC